MTLTRAKKMGSCVHTVLCSTVLQQLRVLIRGFLGHIFKKNVASWPSKAKQTTRKEPTKNTLVISNHDQTQNKT